MSTSLFWGQAGRACGGLSRTGSLKFGAFALRPRLAIKDFALVERKSAGGQTLFHAKLSVVDTPLGSLVSGRSVAEMQSAVDQRFRHQAEVIECLAGSNVAVAIQEATVFVHVDDNGQPRWSQLLQV